MGRPFPNRVAAWRARRVAGGGVSAMVGRPSSATMVGMTLLHSRPLLRVRPLPEGPERSPLVPAAVAALGCGAAGLLVAVTIAVGAWFSTDAGSFQGAVRVGALGWLVAHGSGVVVDGVAVTVAPLGGCLVALLVMWRAGRWVAESSRVDDPRLAAGAVGVFAAVYTAFTGVVTVFAQLPSAHPMTARALLVALVLSSVGAGLGIARGGGHGDSAWSRVPAPVRAVLSGAAAGGCAMLAASAVAFTASMALHLGDAARVMERLDPGLAGGSILTLVGLGLVPNAVLCTGAYLAGPGFAVGSGTTVSATGATVGPLPAVPILAAVPRSGGQWWQEALLLTPVLAGALAGVVTARRHPVPGLVLATLRGAAAGVVGGAVFGAASWLATGALGPGAMRDLGPDVLATTGVCAFAFAVGGAVGGAGWHALATRRQRPADA